MRQFASPSALVGREAELRTLESALGSVASGRPRTVVVGGEAGIGKTRLLQEFLRSPVAEHARVLVGQCVDLGDVAAAYTPVISALRPLLSVMGADRVRELTGAGADPLLALFPELASPGAPAATGPVEQFHEAVATVLEAASAETTVILAFEDVHWIDTATLGLLRFLTRVLVTGRVLLVVSYRSEDVGRGHPVRQLLGELERDRETIRLVLTRLPQGQVRDLAEQLRGLPLAQADLERLMSRSEGVPFFVEELVALDDDGDDVPETLRELLLARYERLDDEAQRLARVLAVGGTEIDHALLRRVWDGADLDGPAREAVRGGVIRADHDAYRFRHALVREAILDDVLPGEHERSHSRYAVEYERIAAETQRPLSAAIAHHWMQARDHARAFPASIRAAREARSALAFGSAAQHGERALSLWHAVPDAARVAGMSRLSLMGRTATHLRNAGELDRSLALLEAALGDCVPGTLDHARLLQNKAKALAYLARGDTIAVFRQALASAETLAESGDPEVVGLHAAVMVSFSGRLMLSGALSEARDLALEGAELARARGDVPTASTGVNIAAVCRGSLGDADGALAELQHAKALAGDDGPALVRYHVNASDLAQLLGRYEQAVDLAQEGVDVARRLGFERTSGVLLSSNLAESLVSLGRWERADAVITRALSLEPPRAYRSHLIATRAAIRTWRGDPDGADDVLREHRTVIAASASGEIQSLMGTGRVAIETALSVGDLDAAWNLTTGILAADDDRLIAGRVHACAWPIARTIAAARHVRSDDQVDEAESRLRAIVERFSHWPTHGMWSPVIDAELDGSTDSWRAARESTRDERAPVHLAPHVLTRLGESLLADGDRGAAGDALEEAILAARAGGVTAVHERARRVAADAGISSGAAPRRGAQALTAREQQVLALVEEGLSNGQIGQRLFISGKTASVHVSSILRKLGASSRTEAVHIASGRR